MLSLRQAPLLRGRQSQEMVRGKGGALGLPLGYPGATPEDPEPMVLLSLRHVHFCIPSGQGSVLIPQSTEHCKRNMLFWAVTLETT